MRDNPKIWFLRHGQTEWNAEHRLQGQLDSPLTAQGRADAARQAEILEPVLATRPQCFASPLGRACLTADIALGGVPYMTDTRLMEVHTGQWQGVFRAEAVAQRQDLADATDLDIYCAAPGGEGFDRFRSRIATFLDTLTAPSVIVAHGLLGQVLRGLICGLDRAEMGTLPNGQGCVYLLENGAETVLRAGKLQQTRLR